MQTLTLHACCGQECKATSIGGFFLLMFFSCPLFRMKSMLMASIALSILEHVCWPFF